ncbi:MAG: glucose-1-phosphate thymidylyltransferase [Pyrobaculum sp.]
MKALILSGGKGTRLRPMTFTLAKQLIPVANRPILGYVLDQVSQVGIDKVGIIIAPDTGHYVKEYVKDGSQWGIKVTYIVQEPLGLAHAVKTARSFLGDDDFVMYLGDNLLGGGIARYLEIFQREHPDALILLKEVDDPSRFGVAVLDKGGNVVKLVEKPKEPISKLAIVGVYFFTAKIHEAVDRIRPSWRGELEITDAVQEMINLGHRVKAETLDTWWIDTGKKDDVLAANALILDEYVKKSIEGEVVNSVVEGRVRVEKEAKVVNSVVRGPAVIGRGAVIENSFIGPYTSVGDYAVVKNSAVEYCVVMEHAEIVGIDRLEESLVGRYAKVVKNSRRGVARLHLGDYSEVEI